MNVRPEIIARLGTRLATLDLVTDFLLGLLHAFPLCCIASYVFRHLFFDGDTTEYQDLASKPIGEGYFVPCTRHAKKWVRQKDLERLAYWIDKNPNQRR